MQVRVRAFARAHARIGAQVSVGVCVRAVSACVRACRDERVAVVVGRRGLDCTCNSRLITWALISATVHIWHLSPQQGGEGREEERDRERRGAAKRGEGRGVVWMDGMGREGKGRG